MVEPKVVTHPFGDQTYTSTLYYGADVRESLRTLKTGSVQCVVTSPPYWGLRSYLPEGSDLKGSEIGLESMPDEYVKSMTEVFREVRRVLRDDGVLWLNLGDSYTSGGRDSRAPDSKDSKGGRENDTRPPTPSGLKPKDLVGIPWMVAFALRADGWYLRSDIIWSKGNPFPESVTDRPTRSHEYVFLLTKSREYFYDHVAVREPFTSADEHSKRKVVYSSHGNGETSRGRGSGHNMLGSPENGRNRRTVWTINPKPYRGAHFATMPPALAELCIKAGSSEKGCCPTCGAPWERVEETVRGAPGTRYRSMQPYDTSENYGTGGGNSGLGEFAKKVREGSHYKATTGWSPTCDCPEHEPVPCVTLDPFSGSGTTGYVSNRLGRNYVGTDLNTEYLPLAEARLLGMDPPENGAPTEEDGDAASIMDMFGGG